MCITAFFNLRENQLDSLCMRSGITLELTERARNAGTI
jgi:hypothetical protein